jgi:hypothetical protein
LTVVWKRPTGPTHTPRWRARMGPLVVSRLLLQLTSSGRTGLRGLSRRSATAGLRNDEGRLGLPRAAFRTRIASENPPREGPPRSRTGYPCPCLCTDEGTSDLEANGRTRPALLGGARLRTLFAAPGTTWGSSFRRPRVAGHSSIAAAQAVVKEQIAFSPTINLEDRTAIRPSRAAPAS